MVTGAMTYDALYRQGKALLQAAPDGDENYANEAFYLLEKVTGISRAQLLTHGNHEVLPAHCEQYRELLRRRIACEPLQYLLGQWEFYGLPFAVGTGVLIPRPETEALVEQTLTFLKPIPHPMVLDLCSGTGCIPIAIAHSRPDATVLGVELSPAAYAYFTENIALNHTKNVTPLQGDVFALSTEITHRRYHAVTSNPPYISRTEMAHLQTEVTREPAMALDGGTDGLGFYRRLPAIAAGLLYAGGLLALEIGNEQGAPVAALLTAAGFASVGVQRDLSGNDRMVSGIWQP